MRILTLQCSAIAMCVASLAACTTVGPDYQLPAAAAIQRPAAAAPFLGASAAAFSAAPLPARWWQLYREPELDALIARAFAANADLRVAAANLARIRAVESEALAAGKPAVAVSAAPAYGRASGAAKGVAHSLPALASYDGGVSVSYQTDMFGKIARAVEAAGADTAAAQAAYDLARVSVAADTTRAYADACAAGQQIGTARRSIALQQDFVASTARQVKAGRGTALDNSRASGQLAQLRAALPPLQAQQRTALYRLAVLTGEVPSAVSAVAGRCAVAPRLHSQIPVGDGAALLRRRPDIRQAERLLAAATARIGVATADLYPSISLGLSAGSTGGLSGLGQANTYRWSLGPLISWNVPDTGSARARIAQAEAGSDAALAQFDAVVLKALRETESALTVYARELERHAALQEASGQSALAASQAQQLYRHGRSDFLATLDAQRTLAAAQSALAASEAQLATDQVNLFLALGGGWEE